MDRASFNSACHVQSFVEVALLDELDNVLASRLHRTLDLEPTIDLDVAAKRVLESARTSIPVGLDTAAVQSRLGSITDRFHRQGVLNPAWLDDQETKMHFWLVNAQPDLLESLASKTSERLEGVSQYVVYGEWDSLIMLRGTEQDVGPLRDELENARYLDATYFSASSTQLSYGYEPRPVDAPAAPLAPKVINRLVLDYDSQSLRETRDVLEQAGVFLGPAWLTDNQAAYRTVAFVGLSVRGRRGVKAQDVLRVLRGEDILRRAVADVFETERGQPFDYFARVVCANMAELDEVTNLIAYPNLGDIHIDTATIIVARGREQLPILRPTAVASALPKEPDLRELEAVARETLTLVGPDAVHAFNELPATDKLVVLRGLEEINRQANQRDWDAERDNLIQAAVAAFAAASLAPPERARMTGPIVEIGNAVEGLLRHVVRLAGEAAFGRDYARIQKEFRLASKNLRILTLGKAVSALRLAREHSELSYLNEAIEEEWLDRVEGFAKLRNRWAHSSVPTDFPRERAVEDARHAIVEGIEIIRWLHSRVLPEITKRATSTDGPIKLRAPAAGPQFGIFISHSKVDRAIAKRTADALSAFNYPVWYDEWHVAPGDSIVERIEEGLAQNDTLVVLLSPDSVKSRWVRRELNSTLMRQLADQNVLIVPILVQPCEIPRALTDIRYVDMSTNFEDGFIQLLNTVRRRREERAERDTC